MDPFKKFNDQAIEFLSRMIVTFPSEVKIRQYKLLFEHIKSSDNKKPVEMFMSSLEPYGFQIMSKDEKFFKSNECVNKAESISGRLGLIDVWESIPKDTKNSIWSYIQNLYVIGMKALGKDEDLKAIIKLVNNRG
jgi:hypothetical protein